MTTKVSSTNLLQKVGGCDAVLMACFSKASMYMLANGKLEALQRKEKEKEIITGGRTNIQAYMYRQSGTDISSITSNIPNPELDTTTTSTLTNNSRPSTSNPSSISRPTLSSSVAGNLRERWVMNLSRIPLTKAQENLLAHGPNFAITPRCPPIGEYIA